MTGKDLVIISQIVLWYANSFRIHCIWNKVFGRKTTFFL